jgi:hypothetical protein
MTLLSSFHWIDILILTGYTGAIISTPDIIRIYRKFHVYHAIHRESTLQLMNNLIWIIGIIIGSVITFSVVGFNNVLGTVPESSVHCITLIFTYLTLGYIHRSIKKIQIPSLSSIG